MTVARPRRTLALVGVVLFSAYAWFYQAGGWNQNSRFALVRALVEEGTVRIDDTVRFDGRLVTGDRAPRGRHTYTDKAPGAELAAAPAVFVAHAFAPTPPTRASLAFLSWVATLTAAALPTVLSALLTFLAACALGASRRAALFASLCFGLATPAWAQATLLFGHALSACCLAAAYFAAVRLRSSVDTARDHRLGWVVGLGTGWAVVTEFPAAVPAAIIAVFALYSAGNTARRIEVLGRLVAGALACALVLGAYNLVAFGSMTTVGYGTVAGFDGMQHGVMGITFPKPTVLYEILLGSYRGLLPLAPALALAPLGLRELIRRPDTRAAGVAASAVVTWYVLFNAAYFYWDGGYSFGPRHMLPCLPFLALGLAFAWNSRPAALRWLLAALTAWGFVVCLAAVSVDAQPPESDHAPVSHYLWPSFASGRLSRNLTAIVDIGPAATRDPAAHAWNLGERLGLHGLASLLPLAAIWAAAVAALGRRVRDELDAIDEPDVASASAVVAPVKVRRRRRRVTG